jgi:hypothetical protein
VATTVVAVSNNKIKHCLLGLLFALHGNPSLLNHSLPHTSKISLTFFSLIIQKAHTFLVEKNHSHLEDQNNGRNKKDLNF